MQTQTQETTTKSTKKPPVKPPVITPDTEIQPVTAPSSTALTTTTTEIEQIEAALGDTVATQTMPTTPNPRDLVGGPVFYILPHNGQRRPGEITFDHETEDQKVDVTIKTRGTRDYPEGSHGSLGVLPVHDVPYAPATKKIAGTWHWRTEKA
jgi:hypothetical protein